jgi:hypothetical protein
LMLQSCSQGNRAKKEEGIDKVTGCLVSFHFSEI